MFESLSNHAVGTEQVGCGDALSVGWVHDDDALVGRLYEVLEVSLVDGDVGRESCRLDVESGGVHGLHVYVISIDMVLELPFLRVVVVDLVKEIAVEVGPFLKGELLSEDARCDVPGDECGFDDDGTAATHGVDEVGVALPSRQEYHASCQYLVEGCLHALLPVSSSVQALSAGVEAEGTVVFSDVHIESYVGIGNADVGSFTRLLPKLVYDGILHLVRYELRVFELLGKDDGVNGEGLVEREVLLPVYGLDLLVDVVGRQGLEVADRFEDAYGGTQLEVGSVHGFLVACKRNHPSPYLDIVCP